MEIVFLGSGGGRVNLIRQYRSSGGFRINASLHIHVDPGPGALVYSAKFNQDPLKLDCIIVTHLHIDHSSDANALIEGMTHYSFKKRGIVIGSKNSVEGNERNDTAFSHYHLSNVESVYSARWGEEKLFSTKKGSFKIKPIKAVHEEPTTFGFKLFIDNIIISYTSDTGFYSGIGNEYKNSDILILNLMKPENDNYKGHLSVDDVREIILTAKPKTAILTHLGVKIIFSNPERIAHELEKDTGVKVIAANDGLKLNLKTLLNLKEDGTDDNSL